MSTGRRSGREGKPVRTKAGRTKAGKGAALENAYQVLQASLSAALWDIKQPLVMVTSPSGGEGKTISCVNLALCYAKAGQRVVLLDLDLRHPDAHRVIGAHNDFGLSDFLLKKRSLEQCLQFIELPGADNPAGGVYFLGTGPVTGNPGELLGGDRASKVLELMAEQADVVLIDTPPVLAVADALVVGRMVSGALLVVQANHSTLPELSRAKELLVRNHTRLFGVVLNKFNPRDRGFWELPITGATASGATVSGTTASP